MQIKYTVKLLQNQWLLKFYVLICIMNSKPVICNKVSFACNQTSNS